MSIVAWGYFILLTDSPILHFFVQPPHFQLLAQEVETLLAKDAIEPVQPNQLGSGFYLRYFTVPKKDGGCRPILDLRNLNVWVLYKKFCMTSVQSILPLLSKGVWMVTLDLKDTYFHISIAPSHRRFLHFAIGDAHYHFKALPFGLASAPRIFTKVMAPIVAYLHRQGVIIFPYSND